MKKLFTLIAAIACTLTLYSQGVAFSWQGLRMTYPSNYKITDKEFDGEFHSFCCEVKNDDISLINFSIAQNGLLDLVSKEDMIEACEEGIGGFVDFLRSMYSNVRLGDLKINRNHRYAYVSRTFTGKLYNTPIYGKIIMIGHGDKIVGMLLQAESQSYLSELEKIANTVRIE